MDKFILSFFFINCSLQDFIRLSISALTISEAKQNVTPALTLVFIGLDT